MDYHFSGSDIWSWEKTFSEFEKMFDIEMPICKLSNVLLSNQFPPCNYYADEDGTLEFEFAVAGYQNDEIDLKFEEDHLVLKLDPKNPKKERKYFQKGIKLSPIVTKAFVPFSKYDVSEATASLEKGILKISVPFREEAKPVGVKIEIR